MSTAGPEHGTDATVRRWADVAGLLRSQHEELLEQLSRLVHLSGQAREDEFLQARRRLAVHGALEAELLSPRLAGEAAATPIDVAKEVLAAEAQGTADPAFEEAATQLLATLLRHAELQEHTVLDRAAGELTTQEQAMAEAGVRLWYGEGEAYLGNDYREMVDSASAQLRDVPDPGSSLV
jgi:hypothetical protein